MSVSVLDSLASLGLLRRDAWIAGQWVPSSQRFAVNDPGSGDCLAEVADSTPASVEAAINAAEAAGATWHAAGARQRHAALMRWFALIGEHAEALARLVTAEQGKPLAEAREEVAYAASFVEWFAEQARRANGEVLAAPTADRRYLVLREPVGVCAAITPWNFPLAMITRKVAPALAAGCTVVAKPVEQTPLSALALAELSARAGLPAGVFNVVTASGAGSRRVGLQLCESEIVRHLSFTGSTAVGRELMRQCAGSLKRLALELGGNAPFIVFDDADLDSAVEGALASKLRNAGQTCVSANRFHVQAGIHDAFVARLAERMQALAVGHGLDPDVAIGPLINGEAVAKVEQHLDDALAHGARLHCGGRGEGGCFRPAVLTGAQPAMLCVREETFGPLAPVMRFKHEAQALAQANAGHAGLAAYVYTRDLGRALRMSEGLRAGMVGLNTGRISTAESPFGGVGHSGFGREGGRDGLEEYLQAKSLCIGGIDA